jgi:hypothetical protein
VAENVLGTIFGRADALKRQLYDMIRNPSDYASMVGGRTQENLATAQALQNQAFSDPQNPLRITNPQALNQLTQMITSGPLGFAPAGITAFHGSPYLFRQFDPMKVGTGEGAQAYGVGSGYTAEARPVAEEYRRATTKDRFSTPSGIFEPSSLEHLNVRATFRKDGLENAIELAKKYGVPNADYPETAAKAARDLQVLESLKQSGGVQPIQGYLYKGDIPDEILPKFLDWDKKFSDQTTEVKEAIKKYWDENKVYGDPSKLSGAGIYDSIVAHVYGDSGRAGAQQAASSELEKIGVRGIRYLDEGSRGSYKAQLTYKDKPYSDVIEFKTKGQLDDYIKESEEKGFGVKTFPQTSNFVPFRPEDYKVQEINDIPIEDYIAKGLL